jgi:hypothetical protein
VIAADDALLDALGRGGPPPEDDKLAGVLAAWRTDLDTDHPGGDLTLLLAELAEDDTAPAAAQDGAAQDGAGPDGAAPSVQAVPSGTGRRRWRPGPRVRRYVTGLAAAGLLAGGLAAGAGQAGPESPLWPVARVLYPERADLRLAEHTIDEARAAAAAGRYDDARRILDKAVGDVERVDDSDRADRLRAQIEEIRRALPPVDTGVSDNPVVPTPSATVPAPPAAVPTTPPAGGGQPADPGQPGGGTDPQQPGGGTVPDVPDIPGVPDVPDIPVPTLPVPIPTLPVPPLGTTVP